MKFKQLSGNPDENIDIANLFWSFAAYWRYFVIIGFISLFISGLYILITPPEYRIKAKMQLISPKSGMSSELKMLKSSGFGSLLGGSSSGINMDDEVTIIQSRAVLGEVIKKMKLQVSYIDKSKLRDRTIYKDEPVNIIFPENFLDTISKPLVINIKSTEGKYDVSIKNSYFKKQQYKNVAFPFSLKTALGQIELIKNAIKQKLPDGEYVVTINPFPIAFDNYVKKLSVKNSTPSSDIILFDMNDNNKNLGMDIINSIMEIYNMYSKNVKISETSVNADFVKEKLSVVESELDTIEKKIEFYKKQNSIPDLDAYGRITYMGTEESQRKTLEIQTQRKLMEYLLEYLRDPRNQYSIAPTLNFAGESLTESYNKLLFERHKLLRSSEITNPSISLINDQLKEQRKALIASVSAGMESIDISLSAINKKSESLSFKLNELPQKEREFIEMKRQQKVKETLYLFLLQKLEEKEISNSPEELAARVLEKAYDSYTPITPNKAMIILASCCFSILISLLILSIKFFIFRKVVTRKELYSELKCPIFANFDGENSFIKLRNLFCQNKLETKTFLITSGSAGDGKNYFANNLARHLSIVDNKVMILNLSSNGNRSENIIPIADYVNNNYSFEQICHETEDGVCFINLGTYESDVKALHSSKMKDLFASIKAKFDIVIILADSYNENYLVYDLESFADNVIIVCRIEHTKRKEIKVINELSESLFPNAFAVINTKLYK